MKKKWLHLGVTTRKKTKKNNKKEAKLDVGPDAISSTNLHFAPGENKPLE